MEDFIPLILGLAYFIFKTYSNFQKEQEKAKERNISSKPVQQDYFEDLYIPEEKREDRFPAKPQPAPFLVEETIDPSHPFEPKYKSVYKEPKAVPEFKELVVEPKAIYEGYNIEQPSEEVLTSRKIHQSHKHKSSKRDQEEETHAYEFDMRDAVIKQAILNRPQY